MPSIAGFAVSAKLLRLYVFAFCASALITHLTRRSARHWSIPAVPVPLSGRATGTNSTVAFATFLTGSGHPTIELPTTIDTSDGYFLSARVLIYQLLHSPRTKTKRDIPFLVLVTQGVSQRKRDRLKNDGAIVVPTQNLDVKWINPGEQRWADVFTKLRLFELTQFDKICFIDADTLVTRPIDGVFDDAATETRRTGRNESAIVADEGPLPEEYMFASRPDTWEPTHPLPPLETDYLNAGYFTFKPSMELFNYYISLMRIPGRFDSNYPEQNLLNYAHRPEGNMPWGRLSYHWNINHPTVRDMDTGIASFHEKYWTKPEDQSDALKRIWARQRWEMEGYFQGREEVLRELGNLQKSP